ncbi:hypothetical protein CRENBAI_011964, partial [Crenichthys baileyi]
RLPRTFPGWLSPPLFPLVDLFPPRSSLQRDGPLMLLQSPEQHAKEEVEEMEEVE